jgi:hypothetical protein
VETCISGPSELGDTAFAAACRRPSPNCSSASSGGSSVAALRCAQLLSTLPALSPTTVAQDGLTNFMWACCAGLLPYVKTVLQSGCADRGIVRAEGGAAGGALLCSVIDAHLAQQKSMINEDTENEGSVPADTRACAMALLQTGWFEPGDKDRYGRPALSAACGAGLHEAVSYWMQHNAEAMDQYICNPALAFAGETPFQLACSCSITFLEVPALASGCLQCAVLLCQRLAQMDQAAVTSAINQAHLASACYAGLDTHVTYILQTALTLSTR